MQWSVGVGNVGKRGPEMSGRPRRTMWAEGTVARVQEGVKAGVGGVARRRRRGGGARVRAESTGGGGAGGPARNRPPHSKGFGSLVM